MESITYLTPKKFLQCCGIEKKRCTEAAISAYLGDQFLNLKIYREGSSFDTYFITQTEITSSRFFMNPPSGKRRRRSISQDKCVDLAGGMTNEVLQSVVETIEARLQNPVYDHPDFDTVLGVMRKNHWVIEKAAEADLVFADQRKDAVKFMILLLASIFQDYYEDTGISRRIRTYLKQENSYLTAETLAVSVKEEAAVPISPLSGLKTNDSYVRRDDLLKKMEQKLKKLELTGEKRFLLMYGAAGNGKSELARAYASEHVGHSFKKEFWLTCPHGEEKLTLDELCRNSRNTGNYADIRSELFHAASDVLLIIDNCNTQMNALINELYYHTGEACVLITSRLSNLSGFDQRNALHVLSDRQEDFCLEVFRKNYEKNRITGIKELTEEETETAREICRRVYMNPLFISMIACFLREHGSRISIGDFAENLSNGFVEAFPRFSQLDFRKDEADSRQLPPLEVLKVILREELNCIRVFGEEERQIMNLLTLFPAEPLSGSQICEILGDNSQQLLMESVMDRLFSIALLQREHDRISIHPLVCELISSGVLLDNGTSILYPDHERDLFYSHVLEHILLFDRISLLQSMHLAHSIYREIRIPDPMLKLVFSAIFDKKVCNEMVRSEMEHPEHPGVVAWINTEAGKTFLLQDMMTGEEKILLNLSDRKLYGRYFGQDRQEQEKHRLQPEEGSSSTEVELLFFYEGRGEEGELITLDFSRKIAGQSITAIPDVFMRRCSRTFLVLLPEGLKRIGDWAFDLCSGLRGPLHLPSSLEHIGKGAFHNCRGLDGELHLPEHLRILDDFAFCLCIKLEGKLVLPDSLEELGEMSFCFCPNLSGEVNCPGSLKRVGQSAFYNSRNLLLPKTFGQLEADSINSESDRNYPLYISPFSDRIEQGAFAGRTDLTGEVKLPASLVEIGDLAFYRCGRIDGTLRFPGSLEKIGAGAFFGCTGLTGGIDLPDSCRKLGDGLFFGCSSLDGSVRLPRRIKEIPTAAFFMCSSIREIRNMEELTELTVIREGAFFRCDSLTNSLYLPEHLVSIEDGAFDSCRNLQGLYFSKTGSIRRLGDGAFFNCSGLKGTLHIPVSMEYVGGGCFHNSGYETCIVYNRDCILNEMFVNQNVLIIGYEGSTAESYAKASGNPFRILE